MIGKYLGLLAAAGLAAAVSLSAGDALADQCGKSYRVNTPACVEWWYEAGQQQAYAKSYCVGTVVLKIDVGGGHKDDLWTLTHNQWKREWYSKKINNVKCCSRMGDGCNQQKLTSTTCQDNYLQSTAAESCRSETFSQSGLECTIQAECYGHTRQKRVCPDDNLPLGCKTVTETVYGPTTGYVKTLEAADVKNCDGRLIPDGC